MSPPLRSSPPANGRDRVRVLQVIVSTDRRGAEVFALDLESALRERGCGVRTVALAPGSQRCGLDVPVLGRRGLAPSTLLALRREARRHDVVVAHGSSTLLACALATVGGPAFVYRNIGDPRYWLDSVGRRFRVRAALGRAAAIAVLWDGAARSFEGLGVPGSKLRIISNAVPRARVDPPANARASVRRHVGIPGDALVAVSVGALSPEKAVGDAVWAVAGIPDLHLLVVGDGRERNELEELARRLAPGRVHFVGASDRAVDHVAASDVLVLPSRTEGIPAAAIEAGMLGVPTVATDVGGVSEVVVHGRTGLLVGPGDRGALRAAIDEAVADRDVLGEAARARSRERFDFDPVADRWRDLIGEIATGVSGSPPRLSPVPSRWSSWLDATLARSPAQFAFRRRSARRLTVLAYHAVSDQDRFAAHLDDLGRRTHPVSLEELVDAMGSGRSLPEHATLVTFDDADRTLLDHAAPVLEERGIPAVAFVVAGFLDTEEPWWWDEVAALIEAGARISGLPPDAAQAVRYLKTVPDDDRVSFIERLRAAGGGSRRGHPHLRTSDLPRFERAGVAVGNHSLSHPILPRCDAATLEHEITESTRILEEAVGRAPDAFAYPNGDADPRAATLLRALDYRAGFLFDHRQASSPAGDLLHISRVRVDEAASLDRLRIVVSGLHPTVHRLRGGS